MSKPITCALCGGMVDDADAVDMPNGAMCLDPCYLWLESMMEDEDYDEDDEFDVVVLYEDDEDDDDE